MWTTVTQAAKSTRTDLSQAVIEYGYIKAKEANGGELCDWMRKIDWVPCSCKTCFFCKQGGFAVAGLKASDPRPADSEEIGQDSHPCVVCKQDAMENYPKLSYAKIRQKCAYTKKGCPV